MRTAIVMLGLLILTPFLFLERRLAEATPGGITHPEYYYGFLGSALVMQLVYLTIGRHPVRFRPLMPVAALATLHGETLALHGLVGDAASGACVRTSASGLEGEALGVQVARALLDAGAGALLGV